LVQTYSILFSKMLKKDLIQVNLTLKQFN